MARNPDPRFYPSRIESKLLGTLKLVELPLGGSSFQRHYEPTQKLKVIGCKMRVDSEGVDSVIWLPDYGVPDTTAFVRELEQRWNQIVQRLDQIVMDSVPLIVEALEQFWQIQDEPRPSAFDLINTMELEQVCFRVGRGEHRLHFLDAGHVVEFHDLLIEMNEDLRPFSANFDG